MPNMQRKPSEILCDLASSLPSETFISLLAKEVYPVLDCLPDRQRSNIISILEAVQESHKEVARKIALINYEVKRDSLQAQLKALNKSVKRDWQDGYEQQAEMMEKIGNEVAAWLPDLWTVGVENGVEITLIHNCLKLCNETIDKAYSCGSRVDFSDFDGEKPIVIKDISGREVYAESYCGLFPAIAWVWRELLLVALMRAADDSQVRSMIEDIERLRFLNDVEAMLREGHATEASAGSSFHDEHWSEEMRNIAPRLKNMLTLRHVSVFESNPTYAAYLSLVSASPALKESLLETTRKCVFQNNRGSWKNVVAIFKDAGSNDDMIKSLESLRNCYPWTPEAAAAQRSVVMYLMMQSDEYRSTARLDLEAGLRRAQRSMWSELEVAFPGLDEAYDYLEDKLESKKLRRRDSPLKGFDRKREAILDKFIKLARSGGDRSSDIENYKYEQRMLSIDEDDSDYEEMREALNPDIAGAIEGWVAVLDKWPNKAEADEIRRKFGVNDDLFYTVDGVAEALASRCDWDYEHSNAKIYVAEGIRAAYDAFGPNGIGSII